MGLVFTTPDGGPVRRPSITELLSVVARKVELGGTFHKIRHTDASFPIAAGESVKVVQARLGHASASETTRAR